MSAHKWDISPPKEIKKESFSALTAALITACVLFSFFFWLFPSDRFFYDMPYIIDGQYWRLITPVFLHGGVVHLAFNMIWLWMLGLHVEQQIGPWRYLLLSFLIAIISNQAQYSVSGPYFLGYSAIICGLAGFIWTRQRRAPFEGYRFAKEIAFLAFFVLIVAAYALISNLWVFFFQIESIDKIANTAHLVGGAVGALLGYLPFFNKRRYKE